MRNNWTAIGYCGGRVPEKRGVYSGASCPEYFFLVSGYEKRMLGYRGHCPKEIFP